MGPCKRLDREGMLGFCQEALSGGSGVGERAAGIGSRGECPRLLQNDRRALAARR